MRQIREVMQADEVKQEEIWSLVGRGDLMVGFINNNSATLV